MEIGTETQRQTERKKQAVNYILSFVCSMSTSQLPLSVE